MSKTLQWFRLYHRIIDDEKIRLLAFEDRWHFIAVCCLKADGLIDEAESDLKWRKIAVKMGVQLRELDEIKRRLSEVGLVDANLQPVAWDELQYRSDNSTERVRKHREKSRGNTTETAGNVSVTPPEAEAEAEAEQYRATRQWTRSDLDAIEGELRRAAHVENDPNARLLDLSPILGLIEAGYSLEADILPTIRARSKAGRRPRSWSYYVDAIREAGTERKQQAQQLKPAAPAIAWLDWCEAFFESGLWKDALGPKPGEPGCRAPPEIVSQAHQSHPDKGRRVA